MARIRTIKPEFWDDEKLSSLPYAARLLFIATWNFADDRGVIKSSPAYLKAKAFPYDDTLRVQEVKKWCDALEKARMLIPVSYNKESYYVIRTFRSHQVIDKRYERYTIPKEVELNSLCALNDNTTGTHSGNDVNTGLEVEGKGNGNGKEVEGKPASAENKIHRFEFKPPTLEEVIAFCKEKGFGAEIAKKAFDHYDLAQWHDSKGEKVKNWKQKINTNWLTAEQKQKENERTSISRAGIGSTAFRQPSKDFSSKL